MNLEKSHFSVDLHCPMCQILNWTFSAEGQRAQHSGGCIAWGCFYDFLGVRNIWLSPVVPVSTAKSLQSTWGLQVAVLRARAGFFAFTLPITFLSEAGGKRSWAIRPGGKAHTLETQAEKGLVQAATWWKHLEEPDHRRQPTGSDSYGGGGFAHLGRITAWEEWGMCLRFQIAKLNFDTH